MAEGQRRDPGGIRGLRELIAEHKEAVEFDLISHGLRLDWLGSELLSWRDLWVLIRWSPRGSALDWATNPEAAEWGLPEHLLASVFDALQIANWQRGSAKRRDFPEPLPRPGVTPKGASFGKGAIPMDEMADFLGWDKEPEVPHV